MHTIPICWSKGRSQYYSSWNTQVITQTVFINRKSLSWLKWYMDSLAMWRKFTSQWWNVANNGRPKMLVTISPAIYLSFGSVDEKHVIHWGTHLTHVYTESLVQQDMRACASYATRRHTKIMYLFTVCHVWWPMTPIYENLQILSFRHGMKFELHMLLHLKEVL